MTATSRSGLLPRALLSARLRSLTVNTSAAFSSHPRCPGVPQIHWQRMLAENSETFDSHCFEDAAILAARASGDSEIQALICKGLAAAYSGLGLHGKMIEYEQQALKIAQETGDVEAECRAYCRLANIHRDYKQPDEAITCLENALAISQRIGDGDTEHECFCTLSVHCSGTGNFQRAIAYGEKALQRASLQGNKEREGSAYGCLGIAFSCKGDHAKAVKWHEKYLQTAKKINNMTMEAQARGYLGGVHLSLDNLLSALDNFEQYLRMARELEDSDMEGRALVCCARTHLRLQQSSSCVRGLLQAVRLGRDTASEVLMDEVKELLGPIYKLVVQEATESIQVQGRPVLESCVTDLEILLQLVQGLGSDEMVASTHNLLITIYMTTGDNRKAMQHCTSALDNALANDDKVQISIQEHLKSLLLGGQAPLSPLSPAIKSWPGGASGASIVPSGLFLEPASDPSRHLARPPSASTTRLPSAEGLSPMHGRPAVGAGTGSGGGGGGGGAHGGKGWERSFKAVTRDGTAEATTGQALVCGTAVLPTVAGHVLGKVLERCGVAGGEGREGAGAVSGGGGHVLKGVRVLKVAQGVNVGVKQTELKLGRSWKEDGSSGKAWFLALDWVPNNTDHGGVGGVVQVSVCNGSQVLHSEVLANPGLVDAAQAVFVAEAQTQDARGGERGVDAGGSFNYREGKEQGIAQLQGLVVEVSVDMGRGTARFSLNGRQIGSSVPGLAGEVVFAAQMRSLGDRVELFEAIDGAKANDSAKSPRPTGGKGGASTVAWSIEDRVRILREKGNLAFKSQDFRHAVQVT
jgi:tetratricopeptide (TPR) repeat protein